MPIMSSERTMSEMKLRRSCGENSRTWLLPSARMTRAFSTIAITQKHYSRLHTGCQVDYTIQKAPNEWKEGENLVKIPCQGGSRTAPQL
jgi:hypothetical protein